MTLRAKRSQLSADRKSSVKGLTDVQNMWLQLRQKAQGKGQAEKSQSQGQEKIDTNA